MILKKIEKDNIIKSIFDSSNILASTYNTKSNDLIVIFKNGLSYQYSNVSVTDYTRFEIDESQGKVLNSVIKKYPVKKLDNQIDVSKIISEINSVKDEEETLLMNNIISDMENIINEYKKSNKLNNLESLSDKLNSYMKKNLND